MVIHVTSMVRYHQASEVSTVVDFLETLIEQAQYKECLSAAEHLLLSGQSSLADLAELNMAVARSRMWLRDYFGAVPAAQLAYKIAADQKYVHLMAKASWVLAAAYYYTRQYDSLISLGYEYYERVPASWQSPVNDAKVSNLIGLAYYYTQNYREGLRAFVRATASYRQAKDNESVLRNTIWSVRCAQAMGDHSQSRSTLAKAMRLARGIPTDVWVHQEILVLRSEDAFRSGRPERGAYLALRALALHVEQSKLAKFRALMLLHKYHFDRGELKDALGYALAGRVTALESRLFHLEYEAAEAMVATVRAASNDDLSELDQEYLSTGVDITRYLPDSVLRHRA